MIPPKQWLVSFLQFYNRKNIKLPSEILVPTAIDKDVLEQILQVNVKTPQRGAKRELLELAGKMLKLH